MLRGLTWGLPEAEFLVAHGVQMMRKRLLPVVKGYRHSDMGFGPEVPADVKRKVGAMEASGMQPLYIATADTLTYLPELAWAEALSEPNLGWSAGTYAQYVEPMVAEAKGLNITLWCGSVANLYTHDLKWLKEVLDRVPDISHVAVHRYPDSDLNPVAPKPRHGSREAEMEALLQVIGKRAWICSEFGYHGAPSPGLTEEEQADRIAYDFDLYERYGASAAVLYQYQDAPVGAEDYDDPIARYGLRTAEGRWKTPILKVFEEAL